MKTTAHKLAEIVHRSNCFAAAVALCCRRMNEPDENPHRHQWPWFVAVAVVLFVVLAVVWMSSAVQREKQERDFNALLPSSAPR
jgi:type VI protein secretion system component VasK